MTAYTIRTSLYVLGLGALGCGGAAETSPPPAATNLEAEVAVFLDAYLDAIGSRDTATLRIQLADSPRYVWVENGAVRYRSVDEMLEGLGSFPADMPIETDLSRLHVAAVGGNGAHAAASFETRVGEGQGAFTFGGIITFVLERHDDTWRIVGGHVSSPSPSARPQEP